MKKLILMALGLVAGATLVHAQGYMEVNGSSAGVTIATNAPGGGFGSAGKTSGAATYDYAILASTTPITDGPADAGWTQVGLSGGSAILAGGASLATGDILYTPSGGSAGGQFQSNLPVGTYYVEVVGWSAGLGSSWSTVESELADSFVGYGGNFFGYSYSGTADFITAASSPGDNVIGADGIANGSLVLDEIPVPEPATLALAGLGGLSMLFLRRRKS